MHASVRQTVRDREAVRGGRRFNEALKYKRGGVEDGGESDYLKTVFPGNTCT